MPNRVLLNRAKSAEARVAILERDIHLLANQSQADIAELQKIIAMQTSLIKFILPSRPTTSSDDIPFAEEVK